MQKLKSEIIWDTVRSKAGDLAETCAENLTTTTLPEASEVIRQAEMWGDFDDALTAAKINAQSWAMFGNSRSQILCDMADYCGSLLPFAAPTTDVGVERVKVIGLIAAKLIELQIAATEKLVL